MKTTTNPVVFLAAAAGAGLVFSAVRNQSPIEFFRLVLQGEDGSGAGEIAPEILERAPEFFEASEPGGQFDPFPGANTESGDSSEFPLDPGNLVSIGGGHRLIAPAAEAFRKWERAYGADIVLTDSYRSVAEQNAARIAAEARGEAGRFAKVSLHSRGIAVDVDLPKTTGGQSTAGQARYDKLVNAGRLTGFISYGGGKVGTDTWHFSWGAVG